MEGHSNGDKDDTWDYVVLIRAFHTYKLFQ